MSSFLDTVSSITPLDTLESSSAPCIKKKGKNKKTSLVWAYTREPLEDEDTTLLYCAYCPLGDLEIILYSANTLLAIAMYI